MKKLFFYAAAAIAVLASCKKSDPVVSTPVDEDAPVAIELGVNAPSITLTKTKAAVNDWNNSSVYVYGLKQERTDGVVNQFGTMYDFTSEDNILGENVKGYLAVANATNPGEEGPSVAPLAIYKDATNRVPYYYSDGQTYDFFGYHLGGAQQGTISAEDDVVSFTVTIDGSNDLMYAYTNKTTDLADFTPKNAETATVADLYSSWAARRGVQPTLVFDHALTRFNFIVKGVGNKFGTVQIQSIKASTVTEGTLTAVGNLPVEGQTSDASTIGYTPSTTATAELVTLKDASDSDIDPQYVKANAENIPYGGEGSSLMVAPGMDKLSVVVTMKNEVATGVWSEEYTYKFEAAAAGVKTEDGTTLTTFAAGTAYDVYINVYGPEEIKVTAELTDWEEGGDYTYDPDDAFRPGSGAGNTTTPSGVEVVNAEAEAVEDEVSFENSIYAEKGFTYENAAATLPWVGVKIDPAIPAGTKIEVQVLKDGNPVNVTLKGVGTAWPADAVGGEKVTMTLERETSIVSFEAKDELGWTEGEDLNYTIVVTKFE